MSEKTQKLFLSTPQADGFCEYVIGDELLGSGPESAPSFRLIPGRSDRQSFGLDDTFWNWVKNDPEVNLQFQAFIDERVNEKLRAKEAEVVENAKQMGREEGIALGRQEAQRELEMQKEALNRLSQSILEEKLHLMRDHEASWVEGFGHLLKRFLVPHRELALAEIDTWMREGLTNFEQTGRVKLHLSDEDYRKLEAILHQMPKSNWELIRDSHLNVGEVRVETNAGGVLFSSQEELKRLEAWIDRFLTEKAPNEI